MNISCDPCPGSNWTQANEDQGAGVYSLSSIINVFLLFPYYLLGFLGNWLRSPGNPGRLEVWDPLWEWWTWETGVDTAGFYT